MNQTNAVMDLQASAQALAETGALFHSRGWCPATSGNLSTVVSRNPYRLLITASGRDKGRLTPADFLQVDEHGRPVDPNAPKPSAETALHLLLTRATQAGAVLHTHSVWGTLLSEKFHKQGGLHLHGFEILKGLAGVKSHEQTVHLEIFENTQDMEGLAEVLLHRMEAAPHPFRFGFLIRRHGLYAWGRDIAEARRHLEVFEFLFEVLAREGS